MPFTLKILTNLIGRSDISGLFCNLNLSALFPAVLCSLCVLRLVLVLFALRRRTRMYATLCHFYLFTKSTRSEGGPIGFINSESKI